MHVGVRIGERLDLEMAEHGLDGRDAFEQRREDDERPGALGHAVARSRAGGGGAAGSRRRRIAGRGRRRSPRRATPRARRPTSRLRARRRRRARMRRRPRGPAAVRTKMLAEVERRRVPEERAPDPRDRPASPPDVLLELGAAGPDEEPSDVRFAGVRFRRRFPGAGRGPPGHAHLILPARTRRASRSRGDSGRGSRSPCGRKLRPGRSGAPPRRGSRAPRRDPNRAFRRASARRPHSRSRPGGPPAAGFRLGPRPRASGRSRASRSATAETSSLALAPYSRARWRRRAANADGAGSGRRSGSRGRIAREKGVRTEPFGADREEIVRESAQVVHEGGAQEARPGPELGERERRDRLERREETLEPHRVEPGVALRHDVPRERLDAGRASVLRSDEARKLSVVRARKVVPDAAHLRLEEMEVVEQPRDGRRDRFARAHVGGEDCRTRGEAPADSRPGATARGGPPPRGRTVHAAPSARACSSRRSRGRNSPNGPRGCSPLILPSRRKLHATSGRASTLRFWPRDVPKLEKFQS